MASWVRRPPPRAAAVRHPPPAAAVRRSPPRAAAVSSALAARRVALQREVLGRAAPGRPTAAPVPRRHPPTQPPGQSPPPSSAACRRSLVSRTNSLRCWTKASPRPAPRTWHAAVQSRSTSWACGVRTCGASPSCVAIWCDAVVCVRARERGRLRCSTGLATPWLTFCRLGCWTSVCWIVLRMWRVARRLLSGSIARCRRVRSKRFSTSR
jgi:hypothetical protein